MFQIPLDPNPKKIQAYSVNPNTQPATKEIQCPARDLIRVQYLPHIRRVLLPRGP